jgi:hypothetical protein
MDRSQTNERCCCCWCFVASNQSFPSAVGESHLNTPWSCWWLHPNQEPQIGFYLFQPDLRYGLDWVEPTPYSSHLHVDGLRGDEMGDTSKNRSKSSIWRSHRFSLAFAMG